MKFRKHYIWFMFILVLTVGCKSKSLSCTKMTMDTDEVKVEERISLTFKSNALSYTIFSLNYYFANDIEINSQATKNTLTEQFSIYDNSKGVEYFFTSMDQGIHFELQAEKDKLTEEEKTNLQNLVEYTSYNDAKEALLEDGYQCS